MAACGVEPSPRPPAAGAWDPAGANALANGPPAGAAAPTVADVHNEPAGMHCPAGGLRLSSGPDINRNGVLDPNEVTSLKYVCNGAAGTSGRDGQNSLIVASDVPLGSTACPTGGKAFAIGLDANRNGTLDSGEIKSTQYVCNGAAGAMGPEGTAGMSSLVSVIPQDIGSPFCAFGGQRGRQRLDTTAACVRRPGSGPRPHPGPAGRRSARTPPVGWSRWRAAWPSPQSKSRRSSCPRR